MHRPLTPPERRLQRATWLVFAPFAFAGRESPLGQRPSRGAQTHCFARLAVRLLQQSLCSGLRARALWLLRSEPAKPPLWYNRSVVMIPFLRHPLSSGFLGKTKFFIIGKYIFDGGGEKFRLSFLFYQEGEGKRTKDDAEYRFIGMKPDDCDCRGRVFKLTTKLINYIFHLLI
jgi:hypothetical protein